MTAIAEAGSALEKIADLGELSEDELMVIRLMAHAWDAAMKDRLTKDQERRVLHGAEPFYFSVKAIDVWQELFPLGSDDPCWP